jgi:hypothetical protein
MGTTPRVGGVIVMDSAAAVDDAEEPAEDGIFDRTFVKTTSANTVRKQTKHLKEAEGKLLIGTI